MPLVGWWPIIHRTNFVAGIFRNFEVILGGIRVDDGDEMGAEHFSGPITHRIDRTTIKTRLRTYELRGQIKQNDTDLDAWILSEFRKGFPENWRELLEQYVDEETSQRSGTTFSSKYQNIEQSVKIVEIEHTQDTRRASESADELFPLFEEAHPSSQLAEAQTASCANFQVESEIQPQNATQSTASSPAQEAYNISAKVIDECGNESDGGTQTQKKYIVELAVKPMFVKMNSTEIRRFYPYLLEHYQSSKQSNCAKSSNNVSALPPQKNNAVVAQQLAAEAYDEHNDNQQQENETPTQSSETLNGSNYGHEALMFDAVNESMDVSLNENVPPVTNPISAAARQKPYYLRQNRVPSKRTFPEFPRKVTKQRKRQLNQSGHKATKESKQKQEKKQTVGAKLYEVAHVLDRRNVGTPAEPSWEFYLKWKGYGNKHNSWEPFESIKDLEIVQMFIEAANQ